MTSVLGHFSLQGICGLLSKNLKVSLLVRWPLILLVFISIGCTKKQNVLFEGQTMGTTYAIKVVPDIHFDKAELGAEIDKLLKEINRQMSTYLPSSEIGRVNHTYEDKPMYISPWFAQVLNFSLELARDTDGAFDPTIGPLVNLWGFGPGLKAGEKRKAPQLSEIEKVKHYVGYEKVSLRPAENERWLLSKVDRRVQLDLSATAKGFAVDKVSELLSLKGLVNHLVDIGGEIKVRGKKLDGTPWVVAVEKPDPLVMGVQIHFPLTDYAVATSGTYRNFFDEGGTRFSHTINSKTGRPVAHNLLSVSVLDPSCMKADGLSTVLMALGPKRAWEYAEANNIAAYFIIAQKQSSKAQKDKAEETGSAKSDTILLTRSTKRFKELTVGAVEIRPE